MGVERDLEILKEWLERNREVPGYRTIKESDCGQHVVRCCEFPHDSEVVMSRQTRKPKYRKLTFPASHSQLLAEVRLSLGSWFHDSICLFLTALVWLRTNCRRRFFLFEMNDSLPDTDSWRTNKAQLCWRASVCPLRSTPLLLPLAVYIRTDL